MTHCNEPMNSEEIAFCQTAADRSLAVSNWFLGTTDEGSMERLNDAHQSLLRVGDFQANPVIYIRTSNRLFDMCLTAGMEFDEPDHEEWASIRIAHWLCAS